MENTTCDVWFWRVWRSWQRSPHSKFPLRRPRSAVTEIPGACETDREAGEVGTAATTASNSAISPASMARTGRAPEIRTIVAVASREVRSGNRAHHKALGAGAGTGGRNRATPPLLTAAASPALTILGSLQAAPPPSQRGRFSLQRLVEHAAPAADEFRSGRAIRKILRYLLAVAALSTWPLSKPNVSRASA